MFCTHCGAQNPEGTRFCTNCGTPLTAEQPQQPQQPAQPLYSQPAYAPPMQEHPVVGEVKRFACSPLFLAAVILFSLSVLFSVISQFTSRDESVALVERVFGWVENALEEAGVEDLGEVGDLLNSVDLKQTFQSTPTFSLPIFPILTAAGLWMIFAAGKKREVPGMNPGGLKMVKIITTIQFVLVVIGLALSILTVGAGAVIFGVGADSIEWPDKFNQLFSGTVEELSRIVLILLIALAAALVIGLVFTILYYSKLIRSIGTVMNTAATGVPSDRISAFAAVLVILSGVSSVSNILSLAEYMPDAMLILSALTGGVASILFGVILFQYRSRMRQLMMGAPLQ